jgi:hypothetical protein
MKLRILASIDSPSVRGTCVTLSGIGFHEDRLALEIPGLPSKDGIVERLGRR